MKIPFLSLLLLTSSALGAQIQLTYSGLITDNGGSEAVAVGDRYSVHVYLPDGVSDTAPDEGWSAYRYNGDLEGFSAVYSVNDLTFSVPATRYLDLEIVDHTPFELNDDRFGFEAFVEEDTGAFFNLFLSDDTRTALESDSFPDELLLSDFTTAGSNLFTSTFELRGDVDTLSYSVVPEPAHTALVCGLFALLAFHRSIRKRRRNA